MPAAKIREYLLSETHPDGRHKAEFFQAVGFSLNDSQLLEQAVRQYLIDHEVAKIELAPFGTRYVAEGIMTTPGGRSPLIRTVWFVRNEEARLRFVTAYPRRRRDDDPRT